MSLIAQLREPTRQQYFAYFAAWSGWVLDAFDFTIFLLVMPQIAKEYGVAHVATAGSIALTLLARLVGGWLAGAAADRWGRKLPLLISVIWFAVCDGAVALAPSFGAILVLRTLFGVGMGAEWTTGTTLAMESMPSKVRGLASGVLQGSWAVGYLLAAAVSAFVLPHWGWRAMFVIAALPALMALPMRWWVPESPEHAARAAHEKYAFPLRRAFKEEPVLLKRLIWGSAVMATGFGAYYGLTGLYPTMLRVELGASDGGVALLVALFNIGMMVGSIVVGVVASRRGEVWAIAAPAALSILAIPLYVGVLPGTLGVGAVLGGAIGCGFCGATPLVLTQLFPAQVRARLVGLVYHIGACFAAFVPMLIATLAKSTGMHLATSIMVVAIACELLVFLLVAGPALAARLSSPTSRSVVRRGAAAAGVTTLTAFALALLPGASSGCLTSSLVATAGEGGAGNGAGPGGEGGAGGPGGKAPVLVQGDDPSQNELNKDAIEYRDLATHPGCTIAGLESRSTGCPANPTAGIGSYGGASICGGGTCASLPGYKCAAKQYDTGNEDKSKPILLLVHGNSDTPSGWEKYPVADGQAQLADSAVAAGFRVYAVDTRFDMSDDPAGNLTTENLPKNIDHGWGVPIVQHFIDSVITAFPDRQISIVGFSLGPTLIRDALRRLHREKKHPFEHVQDLVFASGAHHGVVHGDDLCKTNPTMRGKVGCEMGDRAHYQPTKFHGPLNGPDDAFVTPCADGDVAFGQKGVCGGHKVRYTTIVMHDSTDPGSGQLRDEFVDQASASLGPNANNLTVPADDVDTSRYFCNGAFKNHFGSVRSAVGLQKIMATLTCPAGSDFCIKDDS